MKIKQLFLKLASVALLFTCVSSAQAVTLTPGQYFKLTGGPLSTTALSWVSVGLNGLLSAHLVEANGNVTKILNLAFSSKMGEIDMYDPLAGAKVYNGGYKDIGEYTVAGQVYDVGTLYPVKVYTASNLFKTWFAVFNKTTGAALIGQRDFHLNIGGNVTSQVPEPMSMSLLGLGLLGGAIKRKRATA